MLNLSEIKALARARLSEVSTSSTHWATGDEALHLNRWINDGYNLISQKCGSYFLTQDLILPTYIYSVDASSSGASLVLDTIDGIYPGDWLILSDSTAERLQAVSINAATKTVTVTPNLSTTFTSGTVYKLTYPLHYSVDRLVGIKNITDDGDLTSKSKSWLDKNAPIPQSFGEPSYFIPYGNYSSKETGLTADTGTSATQLKDSALAGGFDNYYRGWYVQSTESTPYTPVRVSSYTLSTTTAVFETSTSASFIAGETYNIGNDQKMIALYPIPDEAKNLLVTYIKRTEKLLNDYDIPYFGAYDHLLDPAICAYLAWRMSAEDEDNRIQSLWAEFQMFLAQVGDYDISEKEWEFE